jgi:hypothetical protein
MKGFAPHRWVRRCLERLRESHRQGVPVYVPRPEDLVIRAKLLDGGEADIAVEPLLTTAGWDGDHRRPRTWWVFDDGSSLVVTRDGRWVEFGIDWSSLWQSFGEENPPTADSGARELTPGEVAERLKRHGKPLPDCLKGVVLPSPRSEPAAASPPNPQPSQATPDREPAVPMTLADAEQKLIAALKKGMKRGSPTRAALVEHMRDKESADAEDVAKHVHDNPGPYDDFDTVGNNCRRVTEEADSLGIPLVYYLRSGKVWKDWSSS